MVWCVWTSPICKCSLAVLVHSAFPSWSWHTEKMSHKTWATYWEVIFLCNLLMLLCTPTATFSHVIQTWGFLSEITAFYKWGDWISVRLRWKRTRTKPPVFWWALFPLHCAVYKEKIKKHTWLSDIKRTWHCSLSCKRVLSCCHCRVTLRASLHSLFHGQPDRMTCWGNCE